MECFVPEHGVNPACLKEQVPKSERKKYIVETMHHSEDNVTAKLCSQQNLSQL